MTDDVEKRWRDPQTFRAAVKYDVAVIAVAAVCFAAYAIPDDRSLIAAVLVPVVLFAGGVGAFVQTYRVWKLRGTWPIWHGAGWFLFMLFLLCLSVPGSALSD
ncbi:hypothetical protein AU196_19680 [Mycobacterium sp. IS-1742]|uniref:hypothetical protein n=1 Tax=Mycobacterium sp. IS-1742 TaxID=1772285 RepID=UPI00074023F0|nr:hypothetical protein [Mycobacterium sp. IS-1742]KUI27552.1 hypothetical protein AU196_19680 [Mycobacterium sp. IS-1742]